MKRAWRAFLVTLALLLLPLMLLSGIAVADRNTRAVGFPDRAPALAVSRQDDGALTVTLFDRSITLSPALDKVREEANLLLKTATPHAAKAGAAITETIIDRILRWVGRAD